MMEVRVLSWSRIKGKAQNRKESSLSIFGFELFLFQSGALEERRSAAKPILSYNGSLSIFCFELFLFQSI
jgi:hypothetical protein